MSPSVVSPPCHHTLDEMLTLQLRGPSNCEFTRRRPTAIAPNPAL
jgi:hypothetical protein